MRIAIDLTPIYDHLTGIERYNINITKELIIQHPEDTYILVFKNEIHKEFKGIIKLQNVKHIILPACNKLVFIQYRLATAMNKIEADYYLFLSFTSPVFFRKKKTISAIHDLTCWDCPETIPTKMKYYYRWTYKASVIKDWRIITVSKFSQRRICEKFSLKEDNVPVIYGGLSDLFKKPSGIDSRHVYEKYNLPSKYLLSLSTIEPRKNIQLLITAYQELSKQNMPDIVFAGRKGWKLDEVLGALDKKNMRKIHFTGFIDDEDLPAIYANAELFVFPSRYEGFGLPLIEAMSQGTLVLCSDAASLPEVVGKSAVLFKSGDKDDLKKQLMYCLSLSLEEKNSLISSARKRAFRFDWSHEAEKLYTIMKKG